jgi:hypothetical protein
MPVTGPIVDAARDEMPETWKALADPQRGYGDTFLERRLNSVMSRYLGAVLSADEQEVLDPLVIEYLGKQLALKMIGAGIDFWSKQRIQTGVQGSRNENTTYKDRAADLKTLRALLLADVAELWVDVQPLFPSRRTAKPAVPVVQDVVNAYTGDPNIMEPAFDYSQVPSWMTGS